LPELLERKTEVSRERSFFMGVVAEGEWYGRRTVRNRVVK
jgi:hypothetical protein